jgi:hypothetical protein
MLIDGSDIVGGHPDQRDLKRFQVAADLRGRDVGSTS